MTENLAGVTDVRGAQATVAEVYAGQHEPSESISLCAPAHICYNNQLESHFGGAGSPCLISRTEYEHLSPSLHSHRARPAGRGL